MGLNRRELSFDFKQICVPKIISQILGEVYMIDNVSDRLLKLDDYVNRFETEMTKILAFQRELPLSTLLISDAIFALKEEAIKFGKQNAEPVLEEFIPLKKVSEELRNDESNIRDKDSGGDKKNWLSSTQLWKTDDDQSNSKSNQTQNQNQNSAFEIKRPCKPSARLSTLLGCRSFQSTGTRKEDKEELSVSSGLSLITPGIKNQREELRPVGLLSSKISSGRTLLFPSPKVQSSLPIVPHQQDSRKQRRCWSPELHRRFVDALQQLGGFQVATPKQIREHMQVDGLTNDEVKSHLQKYRLHIRRLPTSKTSTNENQTPFVLGGGLCMSHDQCGESSKQSDSQNGSPLGPLQLNGSSGGTLTTGGDSMDDDYDEKSESYSWINHTHTSGKVEA